MQPTPDQVAAEVRAMAAGMAADDDVTPLGALITERLGPVDPLRILRRRDDPVRDVLESLAARAGAADPAQRPTPAEFVIALGNHRADHGTRDRRRLVVAIAGALVPVVGAAAWVALPRPRSATERAALPASTTVPKRATTTTTTSTTTTVPMATQVWPPLPSAYADGVLEYDGNRYAVGQPDDVVVVGDWRCDGSPTVALLRPSTGEVFLFADWATRGTDATARRVAVVDEATTIAAEDTDGDGCPELLARLADGTTSMVEVDR